MHDIRNIMDFLLFDFQGGGCHGLRAFPEYTIVTIAGRKTSKRFSLLQI